MATCINYVGAALSGPTIFSIVYSSVTVWTAVYSQFLLGRYMNVYQWISVFVVFGGLTITALDSLQFGDSVVKGTLYVFVGSAFHAMTYVFCEAVMIGDDESQKLTVSQNCAIQANTASILFFLWQLVYTVPRIDSVLWVPMQQAETSIFQALFILILFGVVNLIHSIAFYETLLHLPGGSTSKSTFRSTLSAVQ